MWKYVNLTDNVATPQSVKDNVDTSSSLSVCSPLIDLFVVRIKTRLTMFKEKLFGKNLFEVDTSAKTLFIRGYVILQQNIFHYKNLFNLKVFFCFGF